MQTTPNEVLREQAPKLPESGPMSLPTDCEIELLRQQRIRFDGYFTGPTW